MLTDLLSHLRRLSLTWDGVYRLSQLDDRLLADMGTSRADISRFVRREPVGKQRPVVKAAAAPARNAYLRATAQCSDEDRAEVTA